MQGEPRIIDLLNQVLRRVDRLNQYFIHSRMCKNWGYAVLEKVAYDEAIEETARGPGDPADPRPGGRAEPGRLRHIRVGPTPREQFQSDLALERAALTVLSPGVALCLEVGDHGTREILDRIIVDEEHHIDWIEAQHHKIGEVGYQQYRAQRMYT